MAIDSKHAYRVAPNVLRRDFEAKAPNPQVADGHDLVHTDDGWQYAAPLDLYSRELMRWAMSETMPQELMLSALDVALG